MPTDQNPYDTWRFKLEVSAATAQEANQRRRELLAALDPSRVQHSAGASKISYGPLSPGCLACITGKMSCCFINRMCSATCFFCPQDRGRDREEEAASAEGIVFRDPGPYLAYLEQMGFEGVGFSGGEPLLVPDRLLAFVGAIGKRFGDSVHTWMYTNGDLVEDRILGRLKEAGLGEIRINLSARDYDLAPVVAACRRFNCVTVEIPAIPEDLERMRGITVELEQLGVRYLNLHQLNVTRHNFRQLAGRGYTIVPCLEHHPVVLESELAALELVRHASEQQLDMGVSYCSTIFKTRHQNRAYRRVAAGFAASGAESVSDAGYVLRLTLAGPPEKIDRALATFAAAGASERLWSLNQEHTELVFHRDLLGLLAADESDLELRYFKAGIVPSEITDLSPEQKVRELRLAPDMALTVRRRLAGQSAGLEAKLVARFFASDAGEQRGDWLESLLPETVLWHPLDPLERLDHGLPEILDSRRYWHEIMSRARTNPRLD